MHLNRFIYLKRSRETTSLLPKNITCCFAAFFLLLYTHFAISNTQRISQEPRVFSYQLANGLKLLVKPDHRAPVVTSQVWYKVGSSYETPGITGISHALEHMMFRGTTNHKPGEFSKIIAQQGGEQNAFTSFDYTGYYQVLPKDKLAVSFALESDRMANLSLQHKLFEKERQVVMEERRLRTEDDPESLAYERFRAAAYVTSPYRHPVVGWMHDLKAMTVDDLKHWYKNWYAPNNAILIIVGDVEPDSVYQLAKKYFSQLKPQPSPFLKPVYNLTPLGPKHLVIKTISAKLPILFLGYPVPSLATAKHSSDVYALDVLAALLDHGQSSRLSRHLIRTEQIAADANVHYPIYSRLNCLFTLTGIPTPKHDLKTLKEAFFHEIDDLKTKPVRPEELAKIKNQVIAEYIYKKDSLMQQAAELGQLTAVGLPWQEAYRYVSHIQNVSANQIQYVAKHYLQKNKATETDLIPIANASPLKK